MDNEEKFLDDLGHWAREEDALERRRFDERWQQLSAGTLSEEDDAALRARAEENEAVQLDYEAFRPLDKGFQERLLAQLPSQGRETPSGELAVPPASDDSAPQQEPTTVTPFERPGKASRWAPYRGWLAAAAILVVAITGGTLLRGPQPALPDYRSEFHGAVRTIRSDVADKPQEIPVFSLGSPLRLTLQPERDVEEPIEQHFYLESKSQERRRWVTDVEISPAGTTTALGTLGEDFVIEPGEWNLLVVYGRPGKLPAPDALGSEPPPGADWNMLRTRFQVIAAPPTASDPPSN